MERLVALYRDAIAGTRLREVVPHRDVLHAAIVPERDGIRLPAEPHLPVRARAVLIQKIEDSLALTLRHVLDRMGEHGIDEDRLPSRDRMRADDRMFGARKCLRA